MFVYAVSLTGSSRIDEQTYRELADAANSLVNWKVWISGVSSKHDCYLPGSLNGLKSYSIIVQCNYSLYID